MNVWDLKQGDELAERFELGPISRTDVVRYQGASGDFQPIHHDQGFAQAAGYDAPLVIGMYPAGAASVWAAEYFGPETVRETSIRWSGMVWPGDVLLGVGCIEQTERDSRRLLISITNQKDELVLTLRMRFVQNQPK